jgi:hypothetical protein
VTPLEYLAIGAACFVGSFLGVSVFSFIYVLRKRRIARKMIEELKSELESELSFRNIVQSNFGSGEYE